MCWMHTICHKPGDIGWMKPYQTDMVDETTNGSWLLSRFAGLVVNIGSPTDISFIKPFEGTSYQETAEYGWVTSTGK